MCLYPKLVRNPKYRPNKKNGGKIPEITDRRALVVPASCGKCMECRKQKTNEWRVRLHEDLKVNKDAKFVTLTFSEEALTELKSIAKAKGRYALENEAAGIGVRRFYERWRKKYGKSLRHWLVSELGTKNTERIHIHGIVWTDEIANISKIWKYGHVNIGQQKWDKGKLIFKGEHYCNARTVNYIVKYLSKADPVHKEYRPRMWNSPKIGKNFIDSEKAKANKYKKNGQTKTYYKNPNGTKAALPMYYRNKIYNEAEREKLWMERLDEQTRYINGIKIDISKGNEEYFKILKHEQEKNKRLGFGDNSKNWEKQLYEEQRREARIDEHTQKVVKFGTNRKAVATAGHNAINKKQARVKVYYTKELMEKNLW